jgi:uncharacterized membrane protein YecN with MAPEG domain
MVAIELKPEHGYVLVCAGALAFESLALGGAVGAARAKAFGKEWRDRPAVKALAEEHKKAFPNRKFADGGYPDVRSYGGFHTSSNSDTHAFHSLSTTQMGSGRYCDLLTYEEWVHFNNAQRGHQNMLEALPAALVSLGGAGVLYPLTASVLGAVFGVGRILYAAGYRRSGPAGRVFGVALADVGLLGLIGCSIRAGLKIAGVA